MEDCFLQHMKYVRTLHGVCWTATLLCRHIVVCLSASEIHYVHTKILLFRHDSRIASHLPRFWLCFMVDGVYLLLDPKQDFGFICLAFNLTGLYSDLYQSFVCIFYLWTIATSVLSVSTSNQKYYNNTFIFLSTFNGPNADNNLILYIFDLWNIIENKQFKNKYSNN